VSNENQEISIPFKKIKINKIENASLFFITIPPHSACEIRWASVENSEKLDSKILCGGPLRIAVISD